MLRRIFVLTILGLSAVVMELTVLPDLVAATTHTERATEWVRAHATSLPTTLDALDEYPPILRKEIFRASSAQVRSVFWRSHLERLMDQQKASLSAPQMAFLKRAGETLSPEMYAADVTSRGSVNALCKEAQALFPGQARLFAALGSPEATSRIRAFNYRGIEWAREMLATYAIGRADEARGYCECNNDSWCNEGCGGTCVNNTNDDCGCFWLWECNGVYYAI